MIHRYWIDTGPPPPAEPWLAAVITNLHPGRQLHDWTDTTLPGDLVAQLDTDPLGRDPRHRANVIRWWLLDRYGGTWLDHDIIPLEPLPGGAWTAALHADRTACAVTVPAGHRLPAAMLTAIAAQPRTEHAAILDVSGDRLLQQVTADWPDLGSRCLPLDAAGRTLPGASRWCVHLWSTSSRNWLTDRNRPCQRL